MTSRIYVETSAISCLAAPRIYNAVNASRQHFSYQFCQRRELLRLVISEAVIAEAKVFNAQVVSNRLVFCNALPLLDLPGDALEFTRQFVTKRAAPTKAFTGTVHIATLALHEVDLTASWNYKHIAGPMAIRKI